MSAQTKGKWQLSTGRLSWKVVFWVFTSVVAIEAILLIPSVLMREQELLAQISEVSAGKVDVIKQITQPQMYDEEFLEQVTKLHELENFYLARNLAVSESAHPMSCAVPTRQGGHLWKRALHNHL
ncbi:MAG: hypothetical protein GDA43_10750 [Hormoscilla sp. SP5CHS1]|nr:hypothetical protein [Hormoscilla sp. SP12CHS1]MBC6453627.1 hypothetical protein [Hormoscilla sp. SP5CHS1]